MLERLLLCAPEETFGLQPPGRMAHSAKSARRVAFCTGWGALTGVGLAERSGIKEMWASNESAKKAAEGTHLASRFDNLQFDEDSDLR